MPGKRILTDEQIDDMAMRRERGDSLEQIARHFRAQGVEISREAIGWQCLRVGADLPPGRRGRASRPRKPYYRGTVKVRPFTPRDDARILELEGRGYNPAEIGRALNPPRPPNSIRGRLYALAREEARAEEGADV